MMKINIPFSKFIVNNEKNYQCLNLENVTRLYEIDYISEIHVWKIF